MLLHYNARHGYVVTLPDDFFVGKGNTEPTYPVTLRARLTNAQLSTLRTLAELGGLFALYRVTPDGVEPMPTALIDRTPPPADGDGEGRFWWPTGTGGAIDEKA